MITLGKYNLLEKIGQGGMGEVFRAQDEVLGRTVALKTIGLDSAVGVDDEIGRKLLHEARSAASLNHPNIVTVFDFREEGGKFFLVMELLEGCDLHQAVRQGQIRTFEDKLEVMVQVADGVAFAHERQVIHRDLKPANIRVLPTGSVKIMDFGLARVLQSEATRTGRILGTPHYMSPEQVRGDRVDERSDVFSLGTLFYELLAGRRPFAAEEVHAVLFQVMYRQADPVTLHAPTLPPAIGDVLARAMDKDPEARFRNAAELRDALRGLRGDASGSGPLPAGYPLPAPLSDHDGPSRPFSGGPGSVSGAPSPPTVPSGGASISGSGVSRLAGREPVHVVFLNEESGNRVVQSRDRQETLLRMSLEHGIPHYHECGGHGRCSTCRVRVVKGLDQLEPRNALEARLAHRLGWTDDIRLACQARVKGDVEVQRLILDSQDVGVLLGERAQPTPVQETALAVMSCELLDFDEWIQKAPPYDSIHVLNRLYLQIGEPILGQGGHIQSYTGAGLLAFFGLEGQEARQKCLAAVRAALRAQARMHVFNHYMEKHFGTRLRLGIGLHFARMIVGQLGHPKKMELSAIGSAPSFARAVNRRNVASGTAILASEDLINVVEQELQVGRLLPDEEVLDGRRSTLYEVVDLAQPGAAFIMQNSFERLEARRDEAAETFYEILFAIDPSVRPLFAEVDMRAQGRMLMSMLSTAVRGLDDLDALRPTLLELGARHVAYGVELRHYDSVEHALLETAQRVLGEAFDAVTRLAWTEIYGQIVAVMTEGGASETPTAILSG